MANLKIEKKLNSLPTTLSPNTMYLVQKGPYVVMYVTDSAGTVATPVNSGPGIEPFLLMGVQNG